MDDSMIKKPIHCLLWAVIFVTLVLFPSDTCGSIVYSFDFSNRIIIDTIKSPQGNKYLKIDGDNLWTYGKPGEPEIPYTTLRFLVPDNATNFSVEINNISEVESLITQLPVYPIQDEIAINDYSADMFTPPDDKAYQNHHNSFSAEFIEDSWIEGKYHIATVSVTPLSFNAALNEIQICGKMSISLNFNENNTQSNNINRSNDSNFIDISDVVVNPDFLPNDKYKSTNGTNIVNEEPSRYYIISERELMPALHELSLWKTQKGYKVITKAIEDIYEDVNYGIDTNTDIMDEAASLRKYLQDEFQNHGTFFCLLVGDHKTNVPIRKLKNKGSTDNVGGINGDAYVPTDDYFSDLSDDKYQLYKDEYGIYVDNLTSIGFTPSIYIGRLLCHSREQIANYISKLILYESHPGYGDSEYLDNTSLFVQYDGKYYYSDTKKEMDSIFTNVECFLDSKITDNNASDNPTGEFMLNKINSCGYNSLMGHGEPSTIACSGRRGIGSEWEYIKALNSYSYETGETQISKSPYLENSGLDKMSNFDKPSIIYTLACTTEPFDVYNDGFEFDLSHTMASSYTVGGLYGGVAYLGNTRSGYWSLSPVLERLFLKFIKKNNKIGVAEALSKYSYSPSGISAYYVLHGHNLIGDPEFELWRSCPRELDVSLSYSNNGFSVRGEDLNGCKIIQTDGNGNASVCEITDSKSITHIDSDNNIGSIGIFKSGYLPIVVLDCINQNLEDCDKEFIVRTASFGMNLSDKNKSVEIGANAKLSIKAIDGVYLGSCLKIKSNGILDINSNKIVNIIGSAVSEGGNLIVSGEKVTIGNCFHVEKGARFSVNKKD